MIRKITALLILTAFLALAILIGLPAINATIHSPVAADSHSSLSLAAGSPIPTPGASTNSGVCGGGNGVGN